LKKIDPQHIGDILANAKQTSSLGAILEQAQIWNHWTELVGPALAPYGQPMGFRDKTLVVAAQSSVWMNTFAYKKLALIQRINQMAGRELVSDIFIVHMDD